MWIVTLDCICNSVDGTKEGATCSAFYGVDRQLGWRATLVTVIVLRYGYDLCMWAQIKESLDLLDHELLQRGIAPAQLAIGRPGWRGGPEGDSSR